MCEVSVIVVTYNQEDTIGRTLDSILSQRTDFPFEIVIGDDSSIDSTGEVCREYEKRHPGVVRYIRRGSNLGVAENYFRCIEEARGRYIADCAGDDFWIDPEKLQKEYDVMAADRDIALVHTAWRESDIDGGNPRMPVGRAIPSGGATVVSPGPGAVAAILGRRRGSMVHLCTAMYRRDMIVEEVGKTPGLFRDGEYRCEDLQIITALAARGKIVYLPDVTLNYCVVKGSVSHEGDFGRKYRQVKGNILLTVRLQRHYGDAGQPPMEYLLTTLDYLSAQVYHSGSASLLEDYRQLVGGEELKGLVGEELGFFRAVRCKSLVKRRLRDKIMGIPGLWRLARLIHRRGESR